MDVAILGTGKMGHAISTLLLAGGHRVTLYTHDMAKAPKLQEELGPQARDGATLNVAALGSPLAAPVVFSALYYHISGPVVRSYADQLRGKILVDVANSVNETMTDIVLPGDTSVAEELAKIAPGARVVKALNTTFARALTIGHVGGRPLDVLIAGDDAEAKATVTKLIEAFGLRVLDAGPLKRARQLEGMGFLLVILQSSVDTPWMTAFQLEPVRP